MSSNLSSLSIKQKIALAIVILVILIILTVVFNTIGQKQNQLFDYKNMSAVDFEILGRRTSDREVYWTLNNIIVNFLRAYQIELGIPTDQIIYTVKDYYDILDPSYRNYLSRKDYEKLATTMLDKFVINEDTLKLENVIKQIYIIDDNTNTRQLYFCELNTVKENTFSYIGITLNVDNNRFNIFYLE